MKFTRLLLLPFSCLYASAVWLRNRFYDLHWLKSTRFDQPVIVIGNLLAGGTGKSPMTEYLIRLLAPHYRIATLSRGYGRKTSGFYEVKDSHTATEVGDEPLQFKRKFPAITVAVCENRVQGVKRLLREHDVVLLDDAFQHRSLAPGLSLLLFDYPSLKKPTWLLPAGPYRDQFSERKRADILIVTKTPQQLSDTERRQIRQTIGSHPPKPLFFSSLAYTGPYHLHQPGEPARDLLQKNTHVLLVTGIAHPEPLLKHLQPSVAGVVQLAFADHHPFSEKDIRQIVRHFSHIQSERKIIVTTEKDAQRLAEPAFASLLKGLPIYYMGIRTLFDHPSGQQLDGLILDYCQQQA